MGNVVTVAGAVGGIGASTFAFAMALQAPVPCVLIDGQSSGAPLDLLLGAEQLPGIRWSQVQVRSANISADTIRSGLVAHHGVFLLSADAHAAADPVALTHLVGALRESAGSVVIDLPRRDPARQSLRPDLDVILTPATLLGLVAAGASVRPSTRIVRVETGHADVSPDHCDRFLGRETCGRVRWQSAVTWAATAGEAPPADTDTMRVAAKLWQRGDDDH